MFMMPPFLLALECGQVALLLGLKLTDADLYLTVCFQIACKSRERFERVQKFDRRAVARAPMQTHFSSTRERK